MITLDLNDFKLHKVITLPSVAQYQHIPYAKHLGCECGYASYGRRHSYDIVGYADTKHGYMAVFQCPKCNESYRHHISTTGRYNLQKFIEDLKLQFYLTLKT